MSQELYGNDDLESAARPLRPMSPELRCSFNGKVYSIMSFQMLMTVAVAAVVSVGPVFEFFSNTGLGSTLYILLILSPFFLLCLLYYYRERRPLNNFLPGLFTVGISFGLGLASAMTRVKLILESVILITGVMVCLTLYAFWAARRGYDFNFLRPFLFAVVFVIIVFALIQTFVPLGKTSVMIFGCLVSIMFFWYIIYKTGNLVNRFIFDDDYVWAYAALYLDIIDFFLSLTVFRAATTGREI